MFVGTMLVVINVEMQHPQLFQQIPPAVGMTVDVFQNSVENLLNKCCANEQVEFALADSFFVRTAKMIFFQI